MIEHVQRLLDDNRLRIDTTLGRRPVSDLVKDVTRSDRGVDLKRALLDAGKPDRDLQAAMPVGETLDVVVSRKKWGFIKEPVGRLYVTCVSPTRALAGGAAPAPMTKAEAQKLLSALAIPGKAAVPTTVVIVSTAGATLESHELAERSADRTVIFAAPNGAGGWSVHGPVETKALVDLFDPEPDDTKRKRIREQLDAGGADLMGSGIATDKLAARLALPLQAVEAEVKAYAKERPGLVAKRLDGRVVLFREGAAPNASAAAGGGSSMPIIERMKSLFARKGETEKKIALLSERRTALGQQRDRSYEELSTLEGREADLKAQFKAATTETTKRRVTSQLLQMRKDLDRRQQMLGVLNQQIDVVSTHLHNLELVQQGQTAKLPESEEITADAERAEDMLAKLQADAELAGANAATATAGLTAEEQALYDELAAETAPPAQPTATPQAAVAPRVADDRLPPIPASPASTPPRRSEPEPG